MFGLDLCIGARFTAAQKVTTMEEIDDPAAERPHNKAQSHHRQSGQRFLRDQKERRITHRCREGCDNPAERQSSCHILRDHDDGAATPRERAKTSGNRHLPDRVAPEHRRCVNFQGTLDSVNDEEGRGNKGADLEIGVRNGCEYDIQQFIFDTQHQHRRNDGRRNDDRRTQRMPSGQDLPCGCGVGI